MNSPLKHPPHKYKIPKFTKAEKALVATINSQWDKSKAIYELSTHLQVAATIELATIPIYLNTYYSINRTPGKGSPYFTKAFPKTKVSRFADRAGALIMSVAVEEMQHMSLACNILYSLGEDPQLYRQAPDSYPAVLPGHNQNISPSSKHFGQNIPIPLGRFSFTQLSHLLAIEYPAPVGAPPERGNWDSIGQIYAYIRCIIESDWVENKDFEVRQNRRQIAATEYSPNNIDTGVSDLLTISSCKDALRGIATICFQGEGFSHEAYDDSSQTELPHYYKLLQLQSQLNDYSAEYARPGKAPKNNVAPLPKAPKPPTQQFSPAEIDTLVYPFPFNPVSSQFGAGRDKLVDIADGLFQYMLIMTETVYRIPEPKQKNYFNRSMHQSIIWVMDKYLQALRQIRTADNKFALCATFANIDLGTRAKAHANLRAMVDQFQDQYIDPDTGPKVNWLTSDTAYYLNLIKELPDISLFWGDTQPTPEQLASLPYLKEPSEPQDIGTINPAPFPLITEGFYTGLPRWPLKPPEDNKLPEGALRHTYQVKNDYSGQKAAAV